MWRTGLVAPRHVGSSRTRARTHVPCIGRRVLNHCATREALEIFPKRKCRWPTFRLWKNEKMLWQADSFFFNIYLFIYFWLCWVFVSVQGLSLVAASGGHSSSRCAGLSLSWPPLLRSIGSRCAGSVVVAHGPSCSAACGILPDQGSNLCALH